MPNFDPGYCAEPFVSLVDKVPGTAAYDPKIFRVEWGPIFHRGRLDGSARVLVIGQDPAAHETFVRRILVGEAGARAQGFLAKLGITRSYVMINTYAYSVYDTKNDKDTVGIAAYRNEWIDALVKPGTLEAVVTLGTLARDSWIAWMAYNNAKAQPFAYPSAAYITHPTQPESAANGDPVKLAKETAALLANWNSALTNLAQVVKTLDVTPTSTTYAGTTWQAGDRLPVPAFDFPAGLPTWMLADGWAARIGATPSDKRRNLTLTVPPGVIP